MTEWEREVVEQGRRNVGPMFATIFGKLWHRTSLANLRKILKDGAILPNDGRFAYTYPLSKSSYGRRLGAVSLFDFESCTEDRALSKTGDWLAFFCDGGASMETRAETPSAVTVCIRLNRAALEPRLFVSYEAARIEIKRALIDDHQTWTYIPWVEAWYRAPVPISSFADFFIARRAIDPLQGECVAAGPDALQAIEEINARWMREDDEERLADPNFGTLRALMEARKRN